MGVTGGIAAYKSILLLRLLVRAGAEVKVVMTPAATQFVSPLVLATLSKHPVETAWTKDNHTWANHVLLGRWADLMVVAPATCNSIAKMAHGQCDNLLMAVFLSATCPVMIAPAMDEDMWLHATTHRNLQTLRQDGHIVLPVAHGELGRSREKKFTLFSGRRPEIFAFLGPKPLILALFFGYPGPPPQYLAQIWIDAQI